MAKDVLSFRAGSGDLAKLEALAAQRGVKLATLARGLLNAQLAELGVDISLDALYELRDGLDRRIAQKEAERLAELKAGQQAPDLVLVDVPGRPGVQMKVERADAVKAGLDFQELTEAG